MQKILKKSHILLLSIIMFNSIMAMDMEKNKDKKNTIPIKKKIKKEKQAKQIKKIFIQEQKDIKNEMEKLKNAIKKSQFMQSSFVENNFNILPQIKTQNDFAKLLNDYARISNESMTQRKLLLKLMRNLVTINFCIARKDF